MRGVLAGVSVTSVDRMWEEEGLRWKRRSRWPGREGIVIVRTNVVVGVSPRTNDVGIDGPCCTGTEISGARVRQLLPGITGEADPVLEKPRGNSGTSIRTVGAVNPMGRL